MKKFILSAFILVSILSYSQTDTIKIVKGQKYYKPNAGYGVDTCQAYIIQNKNATGNAGLIAISGTDTMFFFIDGNGFGNIQNDENIYVTCGDSVIFVAKVKIDSTLTLQFGTKVNEFSTDGTLAGDSDDALVTEKAIKTYADAVGSSIWTLAGNYIYQSTLTDSVGIGTNTPTEIFEVNGNSLLDGNATIGDTAQTTVLIIDNDTINSITPLDSASGDLANTTLGMSIIHTDTIYMNGLTRICIKVSIGDDLTYTFPIGESIRGYVWVDGMDASYCANYYIVDDGSCVVQSGGVNVVNTDTDTKICLLDGGTFGTIKNRLDAVKTYNICYEY